MTVTSERDPAAGRRRRGGARRRSATELVIICWRDIPAQVNAGSGEGKVQRILPRRFQRAIDRAAMVAGRTEASQYIGEWRRVPRGSGGEDPTDAALRVAAELEAAYDRQRLETFVATGGWDPDRPEPHDEATGGPEARLHEEDLK